MALHRDSLRSVFPQISAKSFTAFAMHPSHRVINSKVSALNEYKSSYLLTIHLLVVAVLCPSKNRELGYLAPFQHDWHLVMQIPTSDFIKHFSPNGSKVHCAFLLPYCPFKMATCFVLPNIEKKTLYDASTVINGAIKNYIIN